MDLYVCKCNNLVHSPNSTTVQTRSPRLCSTLDGVQRSGKGMYTSLTPVRALPRSGTICVEGNQVTLPNSNNGRHPESLLLDQYVHTGVDDRRGGEGLVTYS